MEIIGLIAEYNPFHNGHLYHIEKIKEMYPDSLLILVLNGYFLERGEVSILSKEHKCELALDNGVDIVVELPFVYGTQSADKFSDASIKILNSLGVKKIVFGSECNDINKLIYIAKKQIEEEVDVKAFLNKGLNYPTSLNKALGCSVDTPNDILGITYIKSILKNKFDIEAISIKRTSDYHDVNSSDKIISASNIREKIKNNIDIKCFVPDMKHFNKIDEDLLFNLLKYKINTSDDLSIYLTVDEGIENKLKKEINSVESIDELIKKIKSKRYTYNRIRRMLIHILIGLKKCDADLEINYIRLLGFSKIGQRYINSVKKKSIPIITKVNEADKIRSYELKASIIYEMLSHEKVLDFEQKNKPIIK